MNIPVTASMDTGERAARDFKLHKGYRIDDVNAMIDACLVAKKP